ncbi:MULTISPECIES: hypothetical protein [Thermodesulfobacterium]|jgi:hypothetical protein|uniref:Addiction module protein n=2 Tax=Thermodesulfobacterium commune TaxID=1741 RepID=A0A075WTS2_9BACT|nr:MULTISPECIES: hypothetical protein [Thermodesulfobacterium]AIH04375.1 hypothetical protein HL41_06340 [Thermodesulfobacterium commune DSM 2178]HAA83620.1 hypothetical protein [Thermodesulfobacterium commune]
MPEYTIINLLKTLPEDVLIDIFWKTTVEVDVSLLTAEEKKRLKRLKMNVEKGKQLSGKI